MATPESYDILLTSRARREIGRLDRQLLARISGAIDKLADDPRPAGSLKVKNREGLWRVRVGDWRIGYEIDDMARAITVITVGHRSHFYD